MTLSFRNQIQHVRRPVTEETPADIEDRILRMQRMLAAQEALYGSRRILLHRHSDGGDEVSLFDDPQALPPHLYRRFFGGQRKAG